jgi:hypothetical protein
MDFASDTKVDLPLFFGGPVRSQTRLGFVFPQPTQFDTPSGLGFVFSPGPSEPPDL